MNSTEHRHALPPCPWCGSTKLKTVHTSFEHPATGAQAEVLFVECTQCLLQAPKITYIPFAIEANANRCAANHWDQSQPPGLDRWSVHRCLDGWFIQDTADYSLFTALSDDDTHPALGALLTDIIRARKELPR